MSPPAAPVSRQQQHGSNRNRSIQRRSRLPVIKRMTNPQVVYAPSYNPSTVYGTWPEQRSSAGS
ncbi:DUF3300 domain-containing protein [Klebsiella pneumoniae]|nr:DUF3300 domain-containing protein [Klebsiella pneumoniae]